MKAEGRGESEEAPVGERGDHQAVDATQVFVSVSASELGLVQFARLLVDGSVEQLPKSIHFSDAKLSGI